LDHIESVKEQVEGITLLGGEPFYKQRDNRSFKKDW